MTSFTVKTNFHPSITMGTSWVPPVKNAVFTKISSIFMIIQHVKGIIALLWAKEREGKPPLQLQLQSFLQKVLEAVKQVPTPGKSSYFYFAILIVMLSHFE